MKKNYFIIVLAFVSLNSLFAATPDATFVSKWQWPIDYWFDGYQPTEPYTRNTALAYSAPTGFAPASDNFDTAWDAISGSGYYIANVSTNSAQNLGTSDFSGAAFKVYYDNSNIYILLKYSDDDIIGTESVEIDISPKLKIDATDLVAHPAAWYTRNMEFGAYVAYFTKTGFGGATMINHVAATGVGSFTYYGTTPTLTNGLKLNDRGATSGAGVVKQIITIAYSTLVGTAFTAFNPTIWKTINNNLYFSGISFDINIVDADTNDPVVSGKAASASYCWNSTSNNGHTYSTLYAGFLKIYDIGTAVNSVSENPKIFGKVTSTEILFTEIADVTVFNMSGEQVLKLKNINKLDMSNMNKGVYVVNANNQILKFNR